MGQIWDFQVFSEEPIEEMADVSCASSELSFGAILTSLNGSSLGILVMLYGCSSLWYPF